MIVVQIACAASPAFMIATDPTNPPMQMLDSDKRIVGFDIDVMNAAATAAGFNATFVPIGWDAIFVGLSLGQYDAVMSSVTITTERMKSMDFTVPYLTVGQVLVVRADAKPIGSFSDLQGSMVGVLVGSASERELTRRGDLNTIGMKTFRSLDPMFPDLVEGKIDAFFCDDHIAAAAVCSDDPKYKGKIKIAGPALAEERFGVAVKKGNREVLDIINRGLEKMMGSEEYLAIKKKWLN